MRTGKYIEDHLGQFIGFAYDSGYIFKGEFGPNNDPFYGDIFNPEKSLIYHGQIIGDIFKYISEYEETGMIKQRPIL